jgi:hypothetical protein
MWMKIISFEPKAKNTFPSFRTQRSVSLLLYAHQSIVIKAEVSVCTLCYDDDDPTNVYMNVYECNERCNVMCK